MLRPAKRGQRAWVRHGGVRAGGGGLAACCRPPDVLPGPAMHGAGSAAGLGAPPQPGAALEAGAAPAFADLAGWGGCGRDDKGTARPGALSF